MELLGFELPTFIAHSFQCNRSENRHTKLVSMDLNKRASFPLSSTNGGSTSSKETNDDCSRDHRPVFMFQPDIKMKAKELEPQPEIDLELRLCTRPSDCIGNGPVVQKKPPAVHHDEASCCWETAGSILLMTSDNRHCNSVAASHSSVASNSVVGGDV